MFIRTGNIWPLIVLHMLHAYFLVTSGTAGPFVVDPLSPRMAKRPFSFKVLLGVVMLNIVTTILHYVDNIIFLDEYPEPAWLSPGIVDAFWFLMTPVVLCGLWSAHRGHRVLSSLCLLVYVGMSLLVLGHYRFAPFHAIGMRIHAFIWLEALAAVVLVIWVVASWSVPVESART